jgi:glycosyltransferase involved in cell wall biosynthesis
MRIAVLAPPWYAVPPRAYGGTESLVAGLADGLHRRGHDVLVIAAGATRTAAPAYATLPEPAEHQLGDETVASLHAVLAEEVISDFEPDIVHDHTVSGPSFAARRRCPTVLTVHGRVSGSYGELLRHQRGVHPVAISQAHRASAPDLPWIATVPNGIPVEAFPFRRAKADQLVFVGRMDPEKGVVEAIEVAQRSGLPLQIAARMHGAAEEEFFASQVRPRLSSTVEYVGELGFAEKTALMGAARALLFPLQWEEPYGLVVAEAQACGTPVLSLRRGAIPELVADGLTGFVEEHHLDLVPDVARAVRLLPETCRAHAVRTMDISTTVTGYERVYVDVLARSSRDATVISLRQPAAAVLRASTASEGSTALAATATTYDPRRDLS